MGDTCPQCGEEYEIVAQHMNSSSSCKLTKETLIEELYRLRSKVERTPFMRDMTEYGKFSAQPYYTNFGSWNGALKEAGLEINVERNIEKNELLEEMQRLADSLERTPTAEDMNKFGTYSTDPYYKKFGSWNGALKEAELDVNNERNIGKDKLIEELHRVKYELKKTPSIRDMNKHGKFSAQPYTYNFESWNEALKEAGLDPVQGQNIGKDALLDELRRLADELGKTPSIPDINERGKFSSQPYKYKFGSWNKALKEAGFDPIQEYPIEPQWANDIEDYYGESWVQKREEAVERDNYECRVCGDDGLLNVHHITPRRMFEYPDDSNTLDNLVTLCPSCHGNFEGQWTNAGVDAFVENARSAYGRTSGVQTELQTPVL